VADSTVQARVEALRRLTRRRVAKPLARALSKSSVEDMVVALAHLTREEALFLFDHLEEDATGGEILAHLSERDFDRLVPLIHLPRLVAWLDAMEPDDEADVLARLPEELREQVLLRIEPDDRTEVEELMAWPDDSAGGIMSPVAFQVSETVTCRQAIEILQELGDVEMVFYIYVTNDNDQLVGVTSLRNLLTHAPSTQLATFMSTDIIAVRPEEDQEEVARLAARFDFLAVPVVDDGQKMLGIVTIDDVIDVIREEAAEDMLLMAGVGEALDPLGASATESARQRIQWLLVTLVAGLALSEVILAFESTLARDAAIAGFIPVVMGMGGNVGIQAATITVRNIATGHVSVSEGMAQLLGREGRVGVLLGLFFGLLLTAWCLVRYPDWTIAAAVGSSIMLALTCAALLGSLIPMTLERLGIDPAVATGPFVTTVIDLLAVVVYFVVCRLLFGL